MTDKRFLMRAIEITGILGVHDRTITRWSLKGLVKKEGVGQYCILSVFQHYRSQLNHDLENLKDKIEQTGERSEKKSLEQEKLEASIKIINSNARIKEHELETLQDSLVDAEKAQTAYKDACLKFQGKALELPKQVSSEIAHLDDPNQINALLQKKINKLLTSLSA